jgi:hypothetical protein
VPLNSQIRSNHFQFHFEPPTDVPLAIQLYNDQIPEKPSLSISFNSIILSPLEKLHLKLEILERRIPHGTDIQNLHHTLSITVLEGYDFTQLGVYQKKCQNPLPRVKVTENDFK